MIAAREMGQPYPSGMDKKPKPPKPYSANWRERRQKARAGAVAYKRRKPEPVWDGVF